MPKFLITDLNLNNSFLDGELSEDDMDNCTDGEISIVCLDDMTQMNSDGDWVAIPSV